MIGILINCIAGLFLVVAGLLILSLVLDSSSSTKPKQRPRRRKSKASRLSSAAPPHLKSRLVTELLNGDSRAAARLVRHAKQNNPGRSETWVLEKVIFDLERDRH